MLADDILKALIEGIIYVAPEPVTLDGIVKVLEGEECERVKAKLDELAADYEQNSHGIQIRQVANGYKFSTKAEHHEVLRKYVKSLKPPVRLSKPALETLAVIAYRQPVTIPEIEEIRGVDSGGVIHTLMEKKLVVTAGRKSVVGRPILYRTSKDFLVHFGLKDVGELPSLKEFEELAKRALGSEWAAGDVPSPAPEALSPSDSGRDTSAGQAAPNAGQEARVPADGESASIMGSLAGQAATAEQAGRVTDEAPLPSADFAPAPGEAVAAVPPGGKSENTEPASAVPSPDLPASAADEASPGDSAKEAEGDSATPQLPLSGAGIPVPDAEKPTSADDSAAIPERHEPER
jgi:segregation and condensation protein B